MKAYLKNFRQSPRKTRLLADFVRGKEVTRVLAELPFVAKRASGPMEKLIKSAVANAKENFGLEQDDLMVKEITVDKGYTFKRFMPRAFGRAAPVHKHTSNVSVVLEKRPKMQSANIKMKNDNAKSESKENKKPKTKNKKIESPEATQ